MSATEKLIFNINPAHQQSLEEYRAVGGYSGLERLLANGDEWGLREILSSGLRGRGGAAFSTGAKLGMVRNNPEGQRYIICNADEGEPGTFKDRFILSNIPFQLLEGIVISAYIAGATQGILYVRHEYEEIQRQIRHSIAIARAANLLGEHILGSSFSFELKIFSGAGSYLCGEETAMLSSIEGRKGRPRIKPPYPTQSGLWGRPTLINNVETLTNLPKILKNGADWFCGIGTEDSRGTKLLSISGDVRRRGLLEVAFGTTLREIIFSHAGGALEGHEIRSVNIGGASGVNLPLELIDTPLEYAACGRAGVTIGSGAIFVQDERRSIVENVASRVRFFLHESCGKCAPCREGLRQANIILQRFLNGKASVSDLDTLSRYTFAIQNASHCGLGQAAGNSIMSSLSYFYQDYAILCSDFRSQEETI